MSEKTKKAPKVEKVDCEIAADLPALEEDDRVTVWLEPNASAHSEIALCGLCGCVSGIDHEYYTKRNGKMVTETWKCPREGYVPVPQKRLVGTNLDWCHAEAKRLGGDVGQDPENHKIAVYVRRSGRV